MIASVLHLSRADIKALRITDAYSLHRVVYDLYEDTRTEAEKSASVSSGILYADKGGDRMSRKILMLSNRAPRQPIYGQIQSKAIAESFLQHSHYCFEIILSPTKRDKASGKTVAVRGREAIAQWFINKTQQSHGFKVKPENLQVNKNSVQVFEKKEHTVTQSSAILMGEFEVIDRTRFIESFKQGIGRGRAFGFGLLQIVPVPHPLNV